MKITIQTNNSNTTRSISDIERDITEISRDITEITKKFNVALKKGNFEEIGELALNKANLEAEKASYEAEKASIEAEMPQFPSTDSAREWRDAGLEICQRFLSSLAKASESLLFMSIICDRLEKPITNDTLKNYMVAYRHQITNCNDLVGLGLLKVDSPLIERVKNNYKFRDNLSPEQAETIKSLQNEVFGDFEEFYKCLIETFIEVK